MLLVVEGLISRLPLIRWPVADPNHELSLIGLLLNFYPQALNLSMAVSQRPLFPRPLVLLWGSGCVGMGVPGHAPGMWYPCGGLSWSTAGCQRGKGEGPLCFLAVGMGFWF